MIFPQKLIEQAAKFPPALKAVWDASLAKHARVVDGQVEVPDVWHYNAIIFALREKRVLEIGEIPQTTPIEAPKPPQPLPRDQWPIAARAMARLASIRDAGVGDTFARVAKALKADSLARFYTKLTGRDCGCGDRQARLNLIFPYPADLTIDCTHAGAGDVALVSWMAEGHRAAGRRVKLLVPNHHRDLAKLFHQATTPTPEGIVLKVGNHTHSYTAELAQQLRTPRICQWQAELPWQASPVRPAAHIPQSERQAVEAFLAAHNPQKRPLVVIYPMSAQCARRLPLSTWLHVAHAIAPACCVVALDGPGSNEVQAFPVWAFGMSWLWQAALLSRAALVLGSDSAGCHLAGTLGRPTFPVMGPTRAEVVFGHLSDVRPIVAPLHCAGCHFQWPAYNAGCDRGCRALLLMEPEQILKAIAPLLSDTLGVNPPRREVPRTEGHQYTSDDEAAILAGIIAQGGHRRILEIGTADGRTAAQVLAACPELEIWHAWDTNPQAGRIPQDARYRVSQPSTEAIAPDTYDFIFIDGDHAYGPAMADSRLALATGAAVVWHDSGNVADVDHVLWDLRGEGVRIQHIAGTRLARLVS